MRNAFRAVMGLVFLFAADLAQAGVEKCVMQIGRNQNATIAPEIILLVDREAKTVEIYDGLIAHFNKETPVKVKITSETAQSFSFTWSLFMVNRHGQRTKMQYVASYFTDTRRLHIQSRPIGYSDVYSAQGVCQLIKG